MYTRLLHHGHMLVPPRAFLQIFASVQMRVLRRISGGVKVAKPERMNQTSVDCLLRRARLRYLERFLRTSPVELLSLLAVPVQEPLPWTKLVWDDGAVYRPC